MLCTGWRPCMQDAQQQLLSRQGKHMWLEFDKGPALMLHFGMTGAFRRAGVAALLSVHHIKTHAA